VVVAALSEPSNWGEYSDAPIVSLRKTNL